MIQLVPFDFEGSPVRIVSGASGEPWFVAADVLRTLALDRKALERLDDDEKGVNSVHTPGGSQEMTVVNEPGLYSLVLGSRKPEAKRFKRWVTHEVIPAIRKTGAYVAPGAKIGDTLEAAKLFEPMFNIARLIGCDTNAAAISANQAVQAVAGPNLLALMGQTHMEAANQESLYFTPTELGKRIGVSARRMNALLAEAGLQVKRGEHWEATDAGRALSRIYDTGKQRSSGVPVQQVKWSADVLPAITGQQAA